MGNARLVQKPFEIANSQGEMLRGDVRYPPGEGQRAVIVICHSFMAFKDWGFFPYVAERIAAAGFVTVSFNFSMDGADVDEPRISRFGLFQRNTISAEIEDLRTLIDAIAGHGFQVGRIDTQRIGLMGHSRGGGVAIVHTASDARIGSLVTWSSVAGFDRWTRHQKEEWRRKGYLPLAKDSAVSPLRLGVNLLDDIEMHREELDLRRSAGKIRIPWLILHGAADVIVPLREAEQLYAASDPGLTRLDVLDHVGHLYSASTREEDGYRTIDDVIDRTIKWFQSTLQQEHSWNNRYP